jgi:hypothetical protein
MPLPLRTNPSFAYLAYRKTIINRTIVFLRRQYLPDEQSQPREVLVCEEVFPVDSHTPPEEVQNYIEHLTEEVAELDRQIRGFEFVSPKQGQHEQKKQKGQGQQHSKSGSGHRQGGRTN